jgi:hypothetical protein
MLTKYKAVLATAGAVVSLAVGLHQYGGYRYEQGYKAATVDAGAALAKQLAEHNQKALEDIAADNKDTAERVRVEYVTQTEIKEVVKYVNKEIIVPADCEPLATSVVGVLSQTTSAINNAAKSSDTD